MAEISKIDYTLGQDNVQHLGLDVHNPVFFVSSLTIVTFVAGVLAFPAGAAAAFVALRAWLTSTFDWVFMGASNLFVLFCLLLVATNSAACAWAGRVPGRTIPGRRGSPCCSPPGRASA